MPQLSPIPLVAPGSRGLNKEREYTLLDPSWATEATNCVISRGGRISARKGWSDQTATGISGSHSIDVLFEYLQEDGTTVVISTANNKVYKNFSDFTDAANDITSTTAPTADNWQFVNFNDYAIGFQTGHNPIVWQNSGDFTDLSLTSTGQPATPDPGNCGCSAFGRLWFADEDNQTLWYSALLDHTDMTTANGAGLVDMSSVWTQGMDEIVAIRALGSNLIVFGKNHIVLWADGSGSEIGLNPTQMYVVDTIEGTGCIARDSIQAIGEGDLWFLSRHGIQSLGRVIQDKNNPLASITKNIKEDILGKITTERGSDSSLAAVRSANSPEEGVYLLILPVNDKIICIDTKFPFPDPFDGSVSYALTEWNMGGTIKSACSRLNGDLIFGSSGVVGKYQDYLDDTSTYTMSFWSAWLDMGAELNTRLKILKSVSTIAQIGGSGNASYRWEFDFSGTNSSKSISYFAPTAAEWGEAEFGEGEFSGTLTIQRREFPGTGQGQYIRVGATITINGFSFSLQNMQLLPKLGRLVA
jgi:hypothetical protein